MTKLWNYKKTETDPNGLKTTVSIVTEDDEVIKGLLNHPDPKTSDRSTKTDFKNPEAKGKSKQKEAPQKPLTLNEPQKLIPKPEAKKLNKSKKLELSRKTVECKAKITHHTRNLNESQIGMSNHNSFSGNRGTNIKKDYEAYRRQVEFSGLSELQKAKILDKIYKFYSEILKYDSQYYSSMVSGPARYPAAKMEAIHNRVSDAYKNFYNYWDSIKDQIKDSSKSKKVLESEKIAKEKSKASSLMESFKFRIEKKEYWLAESYMIDAYKVDPKLFVKMFEELNAIRPYRKNTNIYKLYKSILDGTVTKESLEKRNAEDNKLIFENSDYKISNLKIDAGKRIAIKFTFYPKPQLVYALKKRGFTWYSYKECFICKPERFDLEWAKAISQNYPKYL